MTKQINLPQLIKTSTDETFRTNLKTVVEKNVPFGERLTLYNHIANSIYTDGYTVFAIFAWELGLDYLDSDEIDGVLKADLLRSYGLAWMELNHFDLSIEYLNEAMEFLDNRDDGILIDIYFGLSIVYKHLTDMPKAIEYAKMATHTAKKMNDDFEISRAYLNTGNLLSKTNRYDEALENYQNALKYSTMDEVKSNVLMSLGLLYKNTMEYQKAKETFDEAERLFKKLKFVNEMFELYINYGILYTKLAKFDNAKEYLQMALDYFEEIDDSYNMTICYLNLGRVEQDRAKFSTSLKYFNRGVALCNSDDNLISLASLLYYSRGNIFLSLKEYKKASSDYQIAIQYAKEQNDTSMEASIKNALAGLEADKGNIDTAQKLYQEILEVFQKDNNIEEIVATYTNMALLYEEKAMHQLAHKAYTKALNLAQTIDIPQLEISILINMAEMFASIADSHKAIELYNQTFELLENYDNDDLLSKCYLNLANIYESITEFDLALKYAKLGLALKEKLGYDDKSLYIIYDSLARIYDGLKQEEEAEKYYIKTLQSAKEYNPSHYYGMLVNYGLFLFKFKEDILGAIECYDKAKAYFEKHQKYETLIAINSNYAMIYESQSQREDAIKHYKKALEYADIFISFIEDENIMMKYRINFEHIYENLVQLYIQKKSYKKAFETIENLKSRTFSKILSSNYFHSNKIPKNLLAKEKKLKKELNQILSNDLDIVNLDSMLQPIYKDLSNLYTNMRKIDTNYVLIKENSILGFDRIKGVL